MMVAHQTQGPPATSIELRVRGTVQGVGFRPFVSRLADKIGLAGDVRNTSDGVLIRLFGRPEMVDDFTRLLEEKRPIGARIDSVERREISEDGPEGFRILASIETSPKTAIAADAAMCWECRRELFDPADRRYRYPFLNCTQCGPRYAIQQGVPYDRVRTTMHSFAMCDDCRAEYQNPIDRRFHAEATACPNCGPRLWLEVPSNPIIESRGDGAISDALDRLKRGEIVAIKGLGGLHLACRAFDLGAIETLRLRKCRPRKPFALMVRDCEVASSFVNLSSVAIKALESAEAPIVLSPLKHDITLPPAVAPGLDRVGIMLPYTPLHALLFENLEEPLVMTSGNIRGEPQVIDNDVARRDLAAIADAFLMHDRSIASRVDDSLVQIAGDQVQILRRGRGYAPRPIALPSNFPADHADVLAMGGDIKNAIAFAHHGSLTLSPFVGNLDQAKTFDDLHDLIDATIDRLDCRPSIVAIDSHPTYRSSELGRGLAQRWQATPLTVQHHHAHAAACMVEHGLPLDHPPIAAIVLDGLGMGEAGALWGGEILLSDYRSFQRIASLKPAPLLGGDKAAREPWRNLIAQLLVAFGASEQWPLPFKELLETRPIDLLTNAWRVGLNVPDCTSAGRLFDAVAAALEPAPDQQEYEGEAAMGLQALASKWLSDNVPPLGYELTICQDKSGFVQIDPAPLWSELAQDLLAMKAPGEIAVRFHTGLAKAFVRALLKHMPPSLSAVALSGGVCQNALLADLMRELLSDAGFTVLEARELPANDGGLAIGQAIIALAQSSS